MPYVNEKPNELIDFRRPAGIQILYNLRGGPSAYQLYETVYADGTTIIVRGSSLRTLPGFQDLNGTKKQKEEAQRSLRCDLEPAMLACHTLLERIGNACWDLDFPKPKKKRAPRPSRTGASALRKRRSAIKPEGRNAEVYQVPKKPKKR